jgi:hypothetical protein
MAVYLRLRENPKIVFVSISRNIMEMVLLTVVAFDFLISSSIQSVLQAPIWIEYGAKVGEQVSIWVGYVLLVAAVFASYFFADLYFRDLRILRDTLSNFDVANAKLGSEADRGVLLSVINELFQAKDAPVDAIAPVDANSVATQIGHALHGHITGTHSPGSAKQEAGDSPESQKGCSADGGLAAFNHSIRVNVRSQLPTTGIRSWRIFRYTTAVLFASVASLHYQSLFDFQDDWGFVKTGNAAFDANQTPSLFAPYRDFRSVVG